MPQRKRVEMTALFGLLMQLVFLAISYVLYSKTTPEGAKAGSPALLAQTWFLVPGVFLWVVVLLHGRQRRLAEAEREEMEELKRTRVSEEIFQEQELDRMRAHSALSIFERYMEPAFSVMLAAGLGFLCYWNLRGVLNLGGTVASDKTLAVVMGMAIVSFFGFLLGKYAVGLAHAPETRLLRAPGSYVMGNVVGSLLLMAAMIMVHFGVRWPEAIVSYALPVVMGLIALEILLNLVLNIYRPRMPGREARPAYDSRLLNLVAEPGDVLKTVAATLDYQFGFEISETWFYRFMARAIVPLIVVQVLLLWGLSCVVSVGPGEIAFIERFGCPRVTDADRANGLKATVFGPGYHLKLPWPLENQRVHADMIYSKEVGKILNEPGARTPEGPPPGGPDQQITPMTDENFILWKELHVDPKVGKEADFLVPSETAIEGVKAPALNLVRLMPRIHYRIKRKAGTDEVDPSAAYDFYYRHADPDALIESLAYQVTCRIAASQNFLKWIHIERGKVSDRFAAALQAALDESQMGVELVYAGMPAVHPPAETAKDFEDVISAYEQKETKIHEGDRDASRKVNEAKGKSAQTINEAQAYHYRLQKVSQAERDRFLVQVQAWRKAPEVYRYRSYFSAVEDVLEGHKLYIVPINKEEVQIIDLQDKRSSDVTQINLKEAVQ